jgi:hypothetical protein
MTDRAYCGCEVEAHDLVYVRHDGSEDPYCDYACPAARVEEAGLATGTTCVWACDPT